MESLRRFLLIGNPTAGKGHSQRLALQVHQRLIQSGATSNIEWTSASGDAEHIASDALRSTDRDSTPGICIVPCGGDGTIQEAVNALMAQPEAHGVLGLAPAGRCNDFASSFGLPTGRGSAPSDADQIAEVLLSGETRRVDLGLIEDRYFCTIAAIGFDASVSRYVNDTKLPLTGTPAYLWGTLRVLMSYQPIQIRLQFDDSEFEGSVFLSATANTPSYGGRLRIAPNADVHDGLLDICIVPKMGRIAALRLLRRVLRGQHDAIDGVQFIRTRSLKIETPDPQEIWADGELIARTPATIRVVPDALEVLLPLSREL